MTVDTKKIVRVDGLARAIAASLNATIGKAGSIQGPKGDRGETGPKGEKGEAGTVTPAAAIADLTAAPTAGDFNALLNALRAAGTDRNRRCLHRRFDHCDLGYGAGG